MIELFIRPSLAIVLCCVGVRQESLPPPVLRQIVNPRFDECAVDSEPFEWGFRRKHRTKDAAHAVTKQKQVSVVNIRAIFESVQGLAIAVELVVEVEFSRISLAVAATT